MADLLIRAVVASLLGCLCGLGVHADYLRWHRLGKDTMLSYEGTRFDRYMMHPKPAIIVSVECIILALLVYIVYEGLSRLIIRLLRPRPAQHG